MKINSRYYGVVDYLRNKGNEFRQAVRSIGKKGQPLEQLDEEAPMSISGQLKGMFQPLATTVANVPRALARYKNPGKRLEDLGQGFFGVATLLNAVGILVTAVLHLPLGLARDLLQYLYGGLLNFVGVFKKGVGEAHNKPFLLFTVGGESFIRLEVAGTGILRLAYNVLIAKPLKLIAFVLSRLAQRTFLSLTWVFEAAFTAVRGALQIALWPVALALMPIRELRTWASVPYVHENNSIQKDVKAGNIESTHARFVKDVAKGQLNILNPVEEKRLYEAAAEAEVRLPMLALGQATPQEAYLKFFGDALDVRQGRAAAKAATVTARVDLGGVDYAPLDYVNQDQRVEAATL